MRPVTYRPKGAAAEDHESQRGAGIEAKDNFRGFGPHTAAGLHGNLTSAEYRSLGGPPLAPRGASSRVITNLLTGYAARAPAATGTRTVLVAEVVSTKGVPFLPITSTGRGGCRSAISGASDPPASRRPERPGGVGGSRSGRRSRRHEGGQQARFPPAPDSAIPAGDRS